MMHLPISDLGQASFFHSAISAYQNRVCSVFQPKFPDRRFYSVSALPAQSLSLRWRTIQSSLTFSHLSPVSLPHPYLAITLPLPQIPERFLTHRSRAKGVTITGFVKKEEDMMNRSVSDGEMSALLEILPFKVR